MTDPPEPKRGGTFLYCPWEEREVKSAGRVTFWSCGMVRRRYSGTRFRTLRAYRRHWRRDHL
jgi:hypothetical protein